jgi:hypothetical protein
MTSESHQAIDPASVDLSAPGLPSERAIQPDSISPEYWRAFGIVAFTMNRFIIDHLIRAARHFDNDTEAMVLFGMLSHLNVAHLMTPGSRPSTTLNERGSVPDSQPKLRPVRIRDLAQITGRPRETIRRKLERLEADGRVLKVVDGYVLNVASVDPAMRALSMDGVRRFMEASAVITDALHDAERALAQQSAAGRDGPAEKDRST